MSFGSIQPPVNTQEGISGIATNYFLTISQLSARNAPEVVESKVPQAASRLPEVLTPLVPYMPIGISVLLFISAFGLQMIGSARNAKHIVLAIFISIFAASIPAALVYVQNGTRQNVKAGPEETPRMIRVRQAPDKGVEVRWSTDARQSGAIRISEKPLTQENGTVYVADNRKKMNDHVVIVTNLKKGHTYQFEILSGSVWYDNAGIYPEFTYK